MGANSSPPASDAAMAAATAAMKNKKRKTSDAPLPASLAAAQTSPEGVVANNNAESLHTEATLERMATALDLSHSLLDRALLDPTLPKSTSLAMEDSRSRLEQFSSFVDALRSADVEGVALQLQRMFVSDTGVLSTLRDAADRAVAEANANSTTTEITRMRRISSASIPPVVESNSNRANDISSTANNSENSESNTNNNPESANDANNNNNGNHANESEDVNMDGDMDGDSLGPRSVLHEAEAAQALTGLRLSSTGANSSAAAAAAAAVAAVAAAGGPLPSPRPPMRPTASATPTTTATASSPTLPALGVNMPSVSQQQHHVSVASTPTAAATNTRNLSTIPSSVPYNATPLPSLSPSHGHGHHGHGGPTLSIFAPQQSPMMVMADHGGHMMPTFSPHPGSSSSNGNGLFVTAPSPHQPHPNATMAMSPGSLPSLFARGLLAPIATPYDPSKNEFHGFVVNGNGGANGGNGGNGGGNTPLTPLLTPHGHHLSPFIDWKSLSMTTPLNGNMNNDASTMDSMSQHQQQHQPFPHTMQTPVTTNGNPYHTSSSSSPSHPRDGGGGQASPVKRKSITSKQLVAAAQSHGANLTLPIAKSLAALERTHPARKANPRRWTKEEDDALRTAVENHKEKNWKAIAAQVPGRNHTQCLQRWTKVLAPGLVKGHWSPHEDELLKRLVAGGNKNWGEVAAKIPGRTSKQCRERWHNHLDPNIVRGAYSPEEDRIILEAQARLGNRWSVIAAMLPGRTEDAVKIRWKSHCRLWKARKYLRKSGASGSGNGGDADDGMDGMDPMDGMDEGDSSEDDEGDAQSYDDDEDQQQDNSTATAASVMPVAA